MTLAAMGVKLLLGENITTSLTGLANGTPYMRKALADMFLFAIGRYQPTYLARERNHIENDRPACKQRRVQGDRYRARKWSNCVENTPHGEEGEYPLEDMGLAQRTFRT